MEFSGVFIVDMSGEAGENFHGSRHALHSRPVSAFVSAQGWRFLQGLGRWQAVEGLRKNLVWCTVTGSDFEATPRLNLFIK